MNKAQILSALLLTITYGLVIIDVIAWGYFLEESISATIGLYDRGYGSISAILELLIPFGALLASIIGPFWYRRIGKNGAALFIAILSIALWVGCAFYIAASGI